MKVKHFENDVVAAYGRILRSMRETFGIDTLGKNFEGTPQRIGRAYVEIFEGLIDSDKKVRDLLSRTFPGNLDEMLVQGPIHVWSVCPHHFLPVEMNVWVAYIPDGRLLGLSKLARLVELLAKKPAMQEDTTVEIAKTLDKHLKPKGSACLVKARHLCMEMRGVKQNPYTTTTALFGAFKNQATREEFLSSVNRDA